MMAENSKVGMAITKLLPVDIVRSDEPRAEIFLADGTKLLIRTVVMNVKRMDGQYNTDGTPAYAVNHQTIIMVEAPDTLKRLPQ